MICVKCGKGTGQVFFEDLTNMSKGRVLCKDCKKPGHRHEEVDGEYRGIVTEVIDPAEVANQLNPDISCDFCNKPDPQWLYTLKVDPIEVSDGRMADLGDRWAACDGCSKDADDKTPLGTVLRLGAIGDVTTIMQIHGYVMEGLSNKRAYVRGDDGVIKLGETNAQ